MLREAADRHNLLTVSEVMDQSQIETMLPYTDILQVGARNMQNYTLLRELGYVSKPVLLKRGISATIEELLLSAEYILAGGNPDVILCERASAPSRATRAIPWTSPPSRWSRNSRTCPCWPILRMAPAAVTRLFPWRARQWPREPMACSSKYIRIPTTPSATARNPCVRLSSTC